MRRSMGVGVAALAVALALAACGSGSGSVSASKIGAAAAAKTAAAKSFHVQGTTERSGPDAPQSGVLDAVVDLEHHASRSTQPARTSVVQHACSPSPCNPPQPAQTRVIGPSTLITIGSDSWSKTEGDPSSYVGVGNPPGKWLHLPKGTITDATALYDPAPWLRAMESSADVTLVGQEQVRGVDTAHYRFTSRSTSASAGLTPPSTIDAWISHDDFVRRLRSVATSTSGIKSRDGSTITFTTTLELFDFGVAADIEPPPPGEVVEVPPCNPPGCVSTMLGG